MVGSVTTTQGTVTTGNTAGDVSVGVDVGTVSVGGTATITFRAWDQTDGNANGTAGIDTTTNGGTTAYSTATDTASLTVNPVNDAPVEGAIEGVHSAYSIVEQVFN